MIWHDHKFIEINLWKMDWNAIPTLARNIARIIQCFILFGRRETRVYNTRRAGTDDSGMVDFGLYGAT